jgi:hypothetical protein
MKWNQTATRKCGRPNIHEKEGVKIGTEERNVNDEERIH